MSRICIRCVRILRRGVIPALAALLTLTPGMVLAGETKTPVWVAFGDSMTANGKPGQRWSDRVQQVTGVTVINSGRNNKDTDFAVKVLEKDVLAHGPGLVFVMFGINDQRIPDGGEPDGYAVPPEQYAANLDMIISRIQASGARVVLMTNRPLIQGPGGPPPHGFYLDRNGRGGTLYTLSRKTKDSIRLYNGIVRKKAAEHGTLLVDIWQSLVDAAGNDRDRGIYRVGIDLAGKRLDGVHLSAAGHAFYAVQVLSVLAENGLIPARAAAK